MKLFPVQFPPLRQCVAAAIGLWLIAPRIWAAGAGAPVTVWISAEDGSAELSPKAATRFSDKDASATSQVVVDHSSRYQRVLGLGSSLEHTTCYNLMQLPVEKRRDVIRSVVHPVEGVGMNLMRVCIGTPDFTGEPWYSYDDTPNGGPDPELEHFSIEKDRAFVLPVLKMALEENPDLLFYASPWSPPGWMTSTGDMIGGHLLPEYRDAYARYFVRYIQAYASEGIPVHAVTVQNEPGVDRSRESDPKWHYPSCRWTAEEERDFIKNHLGPAFESHGIDTEIWTYDHNFNVKATPAGDDPGIAYPMTVLRDAGAAKYVDGVAFHGYAGRPVGMRRISAEFPGVPVYFTEGSTFGVRGAAKIISYLENGASSYNAWVTMIDEDGGPNNGPFEASRTIVTFESRTQSVHYHFDYFMYTHFMRFVKRGAQRIGTDTQGIGLSSVAFENPDGSIALIVVNTGRDAVPIAVVWREQISETALPGRSIGTFKWEL